MCITDGSSQSSVMQRQRQIKRFLGAPHKLRYYCLVQPLSCQSLHRGLAQALAVWQGAAQHTRVLQATRPLSKPVHITKELRPAMIWANELGILLMFSTDCLVGRLLAHQVAAGDKCEARSSRVCVIAAALCRDDIAECPGRSPPSRAVQRACRRNQEQ